MADQTHTSRDVIRAVIEEWWTHYQRLGVVHPAVIRADLAERIDRALFELPEDQERALEQWAADEVAARQATRTSLTELEAEVRRLGAWTDEKPPLLNLGLWADGREYVYVEEPELRRWGSGVLAADFPRIAALLRANPTP